MKVQTLFAHFTLVWTVDVSIGPRRNYMYLKLVTQRDNPTEGLNLDVYVNMFRMPIVIIL